MYRIDNPSAVVTLQAPPLPGTPGYFTDGNPAAGLEATIVDAWWVNQIQEEIINVIAAANMTLNKASHTQLRDALLSLFASGSVVGGYLPLTGGRLYRENASDILSIDADLNQSAGILLRSGSLSQWLVNTGGNGNFNITNNTAGVTCLRINTSTFDVEVRGHDFVLADPNQLTQWIARPNSTQSLAIGVTGGANLAGFTVRANNIDFTSGTVQCGDFRSSATAWLNQVRAISSTGVNFIDIVNFVSDVTVGGSLTAATVGAGGITAGASGIISNGHVDLAAGNLSVSAGSAAVAGSITAGTDITAYGMYARGITLQDYGVTSHGNVVLRGTLAGAAESSLLSIWNVVTGTIWGMWAAGGRLSVGLADAAGNRGASYLSVQVGAVVVDANLIVAGTAHKPGGGDWGDSSDRRLKKDIARYQRGLQAVCALEPVSFRFNGLGDRTDDGETYIGLVAQDAAEIMPEMVGWKSMKLRPDDENEQSVATIDTTALKFALVNAVQELASRLEALERKS